MRNAKSFTVKQAFGELLALIALRDLNHSWAKDRLNIECLRSEDPRALEEPIAVGIAFAAAHLWDNVELRTEASQILCHLLPHASDRVCQAIATVFWARQDFAADEATDALLRAIAVHPRILSTIYLSDLVEHLVGLLPHKRDVVLSVCKAIVKSGRQEQRLFEAGPQLVKIAMTLQRFDDTRDQGLTLLEDLLQLGLDDAFRVLHDIDVRPNRKATRPPRKRRRRN
jgi:hypothetical protein